MLLFPSVYHRTENCTGITNVEYGQGRPHFLDMALNVLLLHSTIMFSSIIAVKYDQSSPVVYFK